MAELLQTTLCYLEQNGCYLMLHRIKKKNDVNHDKWIGVGGKLDPGETAEACAMREVWEETGLTMQSPRLPRHCGFYLRAMARRADAPVHLHRFYRHADRL